MSMILLIIGISFIPSFAVITMYILRDPSKRIWTAFLWVLGAGSAAVDIVTPRGDSGLEVSLIASSAAQVWLSRALVLCFLYLVVLGIADWVRRGRPTPRFGLSATALLFTVGPLLSALFGAKGGWDLGLLYLPLAIIAVTVLPPIPARYFVSQVKQVLALYLYGSALATLISPTWATTAYNSFIPGVNFRFNGLAPQANLMGPLALLYIILDWEPTESKWTINRGLPSLLAWTILVLAQSKVTWVIAVAAYLVRPWVKQGSSGPLRRLVQVTQTIVISVVCGASYLLRTDLLQLDQADTVSTLTGRTQIWADTLSIWRRYPWFGYGPTIWSLDFRLAFGGEAYLWVGQAHNQVVQSLGETGVVGLFLLIPYLLSLFFVGVRWNRETRGASLGLALFILLRCITETPLRTYGVNEALFVHLVVFGYLQLRQRQADLQQVPVAC